MKKYICLLLFISTLGTAFGDNYFLAGPKIGVTLLEDPSAYIGIILGYEHYLGIDGNIGFGVDAEMRDYGLLGKNSVMSGSFSPTLQFRIFCGEEYISKGNVTGKVQPFVFKVFPSIGFDYGQLYENGEFNDFHLGCGGEIGYEPRKGWLDKGLFRLYFAFNYWHLLKSQEDIYAITTGAKIYLRKPNAEAFKYSKEYDTWIAEQNRRNQLENLLRQNEKEEQRKLEEAAKQEYENKRIADETFAINSDSLETIYKYIIAYGYSENIKLAIERILSKNPKATYRELDWFDNPYSFDENYIYFCDSLTVYQWLSEYSFLAKVNGQIIYIITANIKDVKSYMSNVFLRAAGTESYSATAGNLKVVPKFELILF